MVNKTGLSLDAGNELDAGIEYFSFGYGVREQDGQWRVKDQAGGWISPRAWSTDGGLSVTLSSLVSGLVSGAHTGGYTTENGEVVHWAEIIMGDKRYRGAGKSYALAACRAVLEFTGQVSGVTGRLYGSTFVQSPKMN